MIIEWCSECGSGKIYSAKGMIVCRSCGAKVEIAALLKEEKLP